MSLWDCYIPDADLPWNLARVVHLHRRAGFGATWQEIERDLAEGPEAAVSRLLKGTSRLNGVPEDFDELSELLGSAAVESGSADRLKAWWIYRCLFTPDPLGERLTLMWHNHFATSNLKVNDLRLMRRQNETLRQFARAPFAELLRAMVHDPALLEWLDAPANRRGHPNENLARELMELFTIGIGHYSEDDVKEAARALTGWTVQRGEFLNRPNLHDPDEKTILGHTGRWTGDELVNLLLDQPHTAERIAWRLCTEFFGEEIVGETELRALAEILRENHLDVSVALETLLRSRLFFSAANLRTRISPPVVFILSPLRALECWRDPPSTLVLADWLKQMGQDLFYPPNVGGWPGGRSWLSTRTVVARANYATALVRGELNRPPQPPDFSGLIIRHCGDATIDQSVRWFGDLFLGGLPKETADGITHHIKDALSDEESRLQEAVRLMLLLPEAQLH